MNNSGRTDGDPRLHRVQRLLPIAFGALALLLVSTAAMTFTVSRRITGHVDSIVENALRGVALLSRMSNDLAQRRTLTWQYVFATDPAHRTELEARLAATETDYEAASQVYEPLTSYPIKAEAWTRLRRDAAQVDRRVGDAEEIDAGVHAAQLGQHLGDVDGGAFADLLGGDDLDGDGLLQRRRIEAAGGHDDRRFVIARGGLD